MRATPSLHMTLCLVKEKKISFFFLRTNFKPNDAGIHLLSTFKSGRLGFPGFPVTILLPSPPLLLLIIIIIIFAFKVRSLSRSRRRRRLCARFFRISTKHFLCSLWPSLWRVSNCRTDSNPTLGTNTRDLSPRDSYFASFLCEQLRMVNARADRCDREPPCSVLKTESKRACARRALEFPCATHFFFFFFFSKPFLAK